MAKDKKGQEEVVEEAQESKASEAEESLVKVKYTGPDGLVNYDVAPHNLVEDPVTGDQGPRALLENDKVYEVPKDLAERLAISGHFEPAEGEEEAKEVFEKKADEEERAEDFTAGERASGVFRELAKEQEKLEEEAKDSEANEDDSSEAEGSEK